MTISKTNQEILSGLTAGFITTTVTHPLDLLKIRLQLDIHSKTHAQALYKVFHSLYHSAHPFQELYRGLPLNLLGTSTAWGVYFASYRFFKDRIHLYNKSQLENHDKNLESWQYLISAFSAGTFTALLTNPIWVLKTRILSTSKLSPGAYANLRVGVRRVLKEEGFLGFWKGLVPSLMGVSQGAVQFTIYDTLKYRFRGDDSTGKLQMWEYIGMSCVSKIVATLMLYPCQILRSRLQDYESINTKKTVKEVMKSIYLKEGGISGFYKGVVPNIIRVLPATCITFGVYEQMRRMV